MNSIQSLQNQQITQLLKPSALRKAAEAPELPKLTKDESSLIEEKFTGRSALEIYSMDGNLSQQQVMRGTNIDTRI
ncbi:hypothetical protein ACKGJO_06135 [Gracilimonas sp. Q87]|uniref:hypothetical protein n=1 Tax=Gracilimonas sp. Q87 TaxID=3384766 RepID=UPI003983E09D